MLEESILNYLGVLRKTHDGHLWKPDGSMKGPFDDGYLEESEDKTKSIRLNIVSLHTRIPRKCSEGRKHYLLATP